MTVTYGGIPLTDPDCLGDAGGGYPGGGPAALDPWLAQAAQDWPGVSREHWATFATSKAVPKPGTLVWPTGAGRFATYRGVVTENQLSAIRLLVYGKANTTYTPQTLKLDDLRSGRNISTSLYPLPAVPLKQRSGANSLYLLTLVDARYFWKEVASSIVVVGGTTTWANLFTSIGSALGITITPDTVSSNYLKPDVSLTSRYESVPMLLDAVCANVGHRFVRLLDGTCKTQAPLTAKTSQDAQLTKWSSVAGGSLAFVPATKPNDLSALVPASVLVEFPRQDSGVPNATPYTTTKTLAGLALAEFSGASGHTGTKFLHDTCAAGYVAAALQNTTELDNLANQIATDFYRWRLSRQVAVFAGIDPYTPEGLSDRVEWTSAGGACVTQICRGPWDDLLEELNHFGATYGSQATCCGGITVTTSTSNVSTTNVTNNFTAGQWFLTATVANWSTNQNNYALTTGTSWLQTNVTSSMTLTGIVAPSPTGSQFVLITNTGTQNLTIANQSSSSTAGYRFQTDTAADETLTPGQTAIAVYDPNASEWRYQGPGTSAAPSGTGADVFGDGSDGSATFDGAATILGLVPSSNVYTLIRDIYCTSITINSGVTIKTANFGIFCTGTLTNNSTTGISAAGTAGGNGSAGVGGTAGTGAGVSAGTFSAIKGGDGGAGGTNASGSAGTAVSAASGNGGSGGGGGAATNGGGAGGGGPGSVAATAGSIHRPPNYFTARPLNSLTTWNDCGGGGGGGGSSSAGNGGGGGGGGGGAAAVFAKAIAGTGTITAAGGNGGNGNGSSGNAGGGGGGGGGVLIAVSGSYGAGATLTAAGGTKGTGFGTGANGVDGNTGVLVQITN